MKSYILSIILFCACDRSEVEKEELMTWDDFLIVGEYVGTATILVESLNTVIYSDSVSAYLSEKDDPYILTFDDSFKYDISEFNLRTGESVSYKNIILYKPITYNNSEFELYPKYEGMYLSDQPYDFNFINAHYDPGGRGLKAVGLNLEAKSTDPDSVYYLSYGANLSLSVNNEGY